MKVKNIRLIGLVILLIAVNLFFWSWKPTYSQLNYQPGRFAVKDSAFVEEVVLTTTDSENVLTKNENTWLLNDRYEVDENLRKILLSVLNKVRIKRQLTEAEIKEIRSADSPEVNVKIRGTEVPAFTVKGNANLTRTYFLDEETGEGYEVEIPGYSDYVGGIFQLNKDQWRDRNVFSGNWRSIQELDIDYIDPERRDLKIDFEGDFFRVADIQQLDSNRVVEYLDRYLNIQANERLSTGRFDRYDSLAETTPLVTITIDDIKINDPIQLDVFPSLPGENILLVLDENEEMMVFNRNRINQLLVEPAYFRYQEKQD